MMKTIELFVQVVGISAKTNESGEVTGRTLEVLPLMLDEKPSRRPPLPPFVQSTAYGHDGTMRFDVPAAESKGIDTGSWLKLSVSSLQESDEDKLAELLAKKSAAVEAVYKRQEESERIGTEFQKEMLKTIKRQSDGY